MPNNLQTINPTKISEQNTQIELERFEKAMILATENKARIIQKMQLVFPPNLNLEQQDYWRRYFDILIEGYLEGVVFLEDIKDFEESFFRIPDQEKDRYLDAFDLMIYRHIKGKYQTLGIIRGIKIEDDINVRKQELPAEYRSLFEYLAYSLMNNEEIDPEIRKFLEDMQNNQLNPEEIAQIHEYNLAQKINQTRRKGLKVTDLEIPDQRSFNKAISPEQLVQYLHKQEDLEELKLKNSQKETKTHKITLEEIEQKELQNAPKIEVRTIHKKNPKNLVWQNQNPQIPTQNQSNQSYNQNYNPNLNQPNPNFGPNQNNIRTQPNPVFLKQRQSTGIKPKPSTFLNQQNFVNQINPNRSFNPKPNQSLKPNNNFTSSQNSNYVQTQSPFSENLNKRNKGLNNRDHLPKR
jgi:hypothetical protein